jgi:hypothetical protein
MADNNLQAALEWLKNPQRTQQVQGIGNTLDEAINSLGASRAKDEALWNQAFSNPQKPLQVTDQAAFNEMNQRTMAGPMGFAPVGMMLGKTAEGMAPLVQKAQQLAFQGYPEYKITELTGLEKIPTPSGFDWGKQISDTGATLNKEAFNNLKIMKGTPLSDVLDHPELYKAYPDLKNLSVEQLGVIFRGPNMAGLYDPTKDLIELNKHLTYGDKGYKDALSTLLHEVQHSIQKRESWPGGTNPGQFTPSSTKRIQSSLSTLEDNLAKEASLLSGNNVSRHTINNALNYLEGRTGYAGKQEAALLEALKGNKDLGEVVKQFQSFDGIRGRLRNRAIKAEQEYNKAASEVQAQATQKQFEEGTMTIPLTKRPEYTSIKSPLNYTDPLGFTIK